MGRWTPRDTRRRASVASALLLCSLLVHPSQAFFGASISRMRGDGYGEEEKVPMTVVESNFSPRLAPTAAAAVPAPTPAPTPTPTPVAGWDDDMPRLPSERLSPGAPSGGNADAPAPAATPGAGTTSTAFISSNPVAPLPAGVTDSATVVPMHTPGQEQGQDVGMGTLLQARAVPLVVPLIMMLSFWALYY